MEIFLEISFIVCLGDARQSLMSRGAPSNTENMFFHLLFSFGTSLALGVI